MASNRLAGACRLAAASLLAALAALAAPTPQAAEIEGLEEAVAEDYGYLESLYKYLHTHPELSFQEASTAERIAGELGDLGFEVTRGIGGHGIVGLLENGEGPTLMIRTDLDALPVEEQTGLAYASTATAVEQTGQEVSVMHACGHDMHMTTFVGAARRLVEMKDRWSGTLMMVGQPAEERVAGAEAMLEDGLFERFPKPDYAVAQHVSAGLETGKVSYVPGYALASVDSVDITVHGIGGHGAYPHATKDPIVLASRIVLELQTIVSREVDPQQPAVITVGSIHGGAKHNIISDRVDMQLTVRSYSDETRRTLLDGIERIAVNAGRAAGLPEDKLPEVEVRDESTPATYNDPELTERLAGALAAAIGEDNVVQSEPVMGGEDFAYYGRAGVPAVIFWLGAVAPEKVAAAERGEIDLPSLHSPFFTPVPEPTIKTGVKAMTTAAMEILGSGE